MKIPTAKGDFHRRVGAEPRLALVNRFFEENPTLSKDGVAFLTRPALQRFLIVGAGPIRHIFCQPGSFNDSMFIMSGEDLYSVSRDAAINFLATDFNGGALSAISMAATARLGTVPEYLFVADGQTLRVYDPSGGGTVTQVVVPDDLGVFSVGFIAGYIIVVPTQGQGVNGRFYWIDPGDKTIDPLNFATAERAPDPVYQVVVFGDQFWLPGQTTTEVWYPTGDPIAPMQRLQGVVFDHGTIEGTALQVKDSMMVVDKDGGVFQIKGGMERVSNPSIEERIRFAIELDNSRRFSL